MGLGKVLLGLAGASGAYVIGKGSDDSTIRKPVSSQDEPNLQRRNAQNDNDQRAYFQNASENENFAALGYPNSTEINASDYQNVFRSTNIGWLDEKLKNKTATAMDAYLAKNYLGINLNEFGDQSLKIDMNAKLSLKKDLDKLADLTATNLNIDQAIGLSKDNLGIAGAWDRWWNDKTHKFADLSDKNARFYAAHYDTLKAKAKADKGGKPTNQDIKDLEKIYGIGASSEMNYLERMYQMKFDTTEKIYQQMQTLIAQNRPIPQGMYFEWQKSKAGLAELKYQLENMAQGKQEKFNYERWMDLQTRREYDPYRKQITHY